MERNKLNDKKKKHLFHPFHTLSYTKLTIKFSIDIQYVDL